MAKYFGEFKGRPTFEMLVGIPGSGKSTYAERYYENDEKAKILSSDKIRKELYGNEAIQGNPTEIFGLMQERTIKYLNEGYDVIYDATNLTRKDRAKILNLLPKFVYAQATIVWAPIEKCIENDQNRERTVGKEIISRMVKRFEIPFYDEGFDFILLQDNFELRTKDGLDFLSQLKIPHDNSHHKLDIYSHSFAVFYYLLERSESKEIALAGLYHDIGKPFVKDFHNSKGEITEEAHYYNHNNVGAWIALQFKNLSIYDIWLISSHMEPYFKSKYYKSLPEYYKKDLDLLNKADLSAH